MALNLRQDTSEGIREDEADLSLMKWAIPFGLLLFSRTVANGHIFLGDESRQGYKPEWLKNGCDCPYINFEYGKNPGV